MKGPVCPEMYPVPPALLRTQHQQASFPSLLELHLPFRRPRTEGSLSVAFLLSVEESFA